VRLHDLEAIRAYFQDNDALIEVNHQLASPITCLGDGHDVWNIIDEIALTVNVGKFSIGIT